MKQSKWETIIKLNQGNETFESTYPLEQYATFTEIKDALAHYEKTYKGNYDELRFEYKTNLHGYGAQTTWYELQGRYTDSTKIILYGQE